MIIRYSNKLTIWVLVALVLLVPAWICSRWGIKRGILKFLMPWSFFNFVWLVAYMIFSRDPFAEFLIFYVLAFGLFSVIFYWWWDSGSGKKSRHER